MAIDALVAPFLRLEIFQGLSMPQIEEIARGAERVVFRPGDVIVNGNFSNEGAVLLVSGEAVIAGDHAIADLGQIEILNLPGRVVAPHAAPDETEIADRPFVVQRTPRQRSREQLIPVMEVPPVGNIESDRAESAAGRSPGLTLLRNHLS